MSDWKGNRQRVARPPSSQGFMHSRYRTEAKNYQMSPVSTF
jgi:hypothetical protein